MNEALILLRSAIAGAALGAVFFGGLWWTVRRGASSAYPALWFLASLVLRTGIVLAGFYVVAGPHWQRLLLCLLGFTLARLAVTRATRATGMARRASPKEAGHAP
ncbi:MAG: ATP synthase subunit I [Burkholderiaceae bacterium]